MVSAFTPVNKSGHPADLELHQSGPTGCSGKNTLRRKANLTLFAMAGQDDDLPFRIELWDDKDSHIEEVIALASDYATARGAFDEAVKRRPQAHHAPAEGAGHTEESLICNVSAATSQ